MRIDNPLLFWNGSKGSCQLTYSTGGNDLLKVGGCFFTPVHKVAIVSNYEINLHVCHVKLLPGDSLNAFAKSINLKYFFLTERNQLSVLSVFKPSLFS